MIQIYYYRIIYSCQLLYLEIMHLQYNNTIYNYYNLQIKYNNIIVNIIFH